MKALLIRLIVLFIFLLSFSVVNGQFCYVTLDKNEVNLNGQSSAYITASYSGDCSFPNLSVDPNTIPSWASVTIISNTIKVTPDPLPSSIDYREKWLIVLVNGSTSGGFKIFQGEEAPPPPPPSCYVTGFNGLSFNELGQSQILNLEYSDCSSTGNFIFRTDMGDYLPNWIQITQPTSSTIKVEVDQNSLSSRSVEVIGTANIAGKQIQIRGSFSQASCVPPEPSMPYVKTQACGSTVLERADVPTEDRATWYWQDSVEKTSTANSSKTITLTSGTVYYLRARNNTSECWSSALAVNYTVTSPSIWYADSDGDGFGDSNTTQSACSKPPGYVENDNDECPDVASSNSNGCPYDQLSLSNENYIYIRTYQRPMSTDQNISENSDVIEQVTYFDGLGRPMQEVAIKGSPTDQKDIVRHIGYDGYGRQAKNWLPYPATENIGSYRGTDPSRATQTYYENNYSDDVIQGVANSYAEKQFEASPLNRVLKQAAPGKEWELGSGHELTFAYDANINAEVRSFVVDLSTSYKPTLSVSTTNSGFYAAGELYKTITYDENHTSGKLHSTEEFTDKQGQVVLKRTYGPSDVDMNGSISTTEQAVAHDTYYVYDDYGNLTYVLPPKMNATTASLSTIQSNLDALGYQYVYDGRNRLVEKQVAGKEVEYIVYNKLDQPILTQDANQRISNEWLFTKYDAFGRIAYTGKATDSRERSHIQVDVSAYTGQLWVERVAFTSLGGAPIYYSNHGYPNATSTTGLTEVLTIQYYDDYNFPELLQGQVPSNLDSWGVPVDPNAKGLPTISQTKVLSTSGDWINSAIAYDDKGRQIWSYSGNSYLKTTTIVATQLDFPGRVTGTYTLHQKEGKDDLVTIDTYSYDHMGRLKEHLQQIGGYDQPAELIAHNQYDDLGQLISKGVGNTTAQPLQTVSYAYNIRGWLKKINNPSGLGTNLFGFEIKYNDITDPTKKLYNGNISQTLWNSKSVNPTPPNNPVSNQYTYSYDALNRITGAVDNTTNYSVSGITYDQNGNITKLLRKGHTNESATTFGNMDNLTYGYDSGNKLLSVTDAVATPTLMKGEFKDGNKTGNDYNYDDNGNLIQDLNKGIAAGGITYNHLNLPSSITTGNGNISYIYDASGTKLQKRVTEGSSVTSITDYSGNYIYENGDLQFFSHPEGYVNAEGSGYKYVYQYKDHLGNIRLGYTDDPSNPGTPTIIEENNYYPFGLKHKGYNHGTSSLGNSVAQRWKYNGKEYDESLDINTYDFGARNYNPAIGRWMNVDPLAETTMQPYSAFNSNPIRYIDPDGRMAVDVMPPSTHIDQDGNVVAVFDDGDNGVYQHGTNADGGTVTEYQLSKRAEKQGTSSGGTKVGETEHWDEFVSPETGKTMTNYNIQVGKSFDPIISEMNAKSKDMNLMEIAQASKIGQLFDIKTDYKNVGGLLNGKYATSRSAGNFLAGYNAEGGTILGAGISFTTFQKLAGALHIENSHGKQLSKGQMLDIVTLGTYMSSDISKFKAPTWGEVMYQYRMSRAGWKFGESQK